MLKQREADLEKREMTMLQRELDIMKTSSSPKLSEEKGGNSRIDFSTKELSSDAFTQWSVTHLVFP